MFISRTRLLAILLFVAGFILLWIFRSQQQFADGLSYAMMAKSGKDMFNPHDMILPFVIHLLYTFSLHITPHVDILVVAQLHNILYGAVTLVCVFLIAYHITRWLVPAFTLTTALTISGGFWLFLAVVEVYVPAQAWLAVASVILLYRPKAVYEGSAWVWVSLCIVCSTLYHQTGVLFIVPLLAYTACMPGTLRSRLFTYVKTVGLAAALLLTAYIIVFIHTTHGFSVTGFYKYCFQYYYTLKQYNTDWGTVQNISKSGFAKFFESIIVSLYSVEPGDTLQLKWKVGICWLILIAGMIVLALVNNNRYKAITLFFSTWLLAYGAFLLWWTPGFEFFSLLLFPLWILVFIAIYRIVMLLSDWLIPYYSFSAVVLVITVLLFIHNYPVFKTYHTEPNIGMREAKRFHTIVGDSGFAICSYNTQTYLRYYYPGVQNIENTKYLGAFYVHDTVPKIFVKASNNTLAIPLWQFTPWYDWNGKNGWDKPKEWAAFCQSLLHITKQSDSAYTARICHIHNGNKPDEDAFLAIDTHARTFTSPQAVFIQLDSVIKASGDTKNIVFADWYKKNGATIVP